MKKMVMIRMVGNRPYLVEHGPAARAPTSPPRVKMEETSPNKAGVMGMHCESRALPLTYMAFFLQVITS